MNYLLKLLETIPGLTYNYSGPLLVLSESSYGFKHSYYVKSRFGRQELHRELIRLQTKNARWNKVFDYYNGH